MSMSDFGVRLHPFRLKGKQTYLHRPGTAFDVGSQPYAGTAEGLRLFGK
jgi:hypothetical protein